MYNGCALGKQPTMRHRPDGPNTRGQGHLAQGSLPALNHGPNAGQANGLHDQAGSALGLIIAEAHGTQRYQYRRITGLQELAEIR